MLSLAFHIIFASAFALLIKWAQVRGREDEITFGAINYIVAALTILPFFWIDRPKELSPGAMIAGASMGLIYFMAYFLAIYSIRKIGVASATVISVLSILFPIAFAAMMYDEQPSMIQVVGITLALTALTLIGAQAKPDKSGNGPTIELSEDKQKQDANSGSNKWILPLALFLFFLLCGLSRIAQEAFKHAIEFEGRIESVHRPTFCIAAFGAAAIPSIVMLIWRGKKILSMELGIGISMGVSNILQIVFILKALENFPGFIVFPLGSAGGVVFVTLVATGLLGERLTRRTMIGIALSVVSLFLLNLSNNWLDDIRGFLNEIGF